MTHPAAESSAAGSSGAGSSGDSVPAYPVAGDSGPPAGDGGLPGQADDGGLPGQADTVAGRLALLRARLAGPLPGDGVWGWVWPLVVTAFGGFLRFWRLSVPHAVVFDETYYAKDAWSILHHGVEWNTVKHANQLMLSGHTDIFIHGCNHVPGTVNACAEYVVQPEVGKLLIAAGEWLFGLTPLGWRFASAVFGTAAILIMCRAARRMTRSTLLGCVAGLLMSLDGMELVLSRTGILDIFLLFFTLAAFAALLADRDWFRARLAQAVAEGGPLAGQSWRPGIRKWRVTAGILLGLATGVKWDAAYYIIGFALLALAWDTGARKSAGIPSPFLTALRRDGKWLPVTFAALPLATYTATWTNWFLTSTGYDRNYAALQGVRIPVISALYSWYEYHYQAITFGLGLGTSHPYQSQPWDWLVMTRPVAFFYGCYKTPHALPAQTVKGCSGGPPYSQEVLLLGTPAIWWAAIAALTVCLGWWLLYRDWRAGAVLSAVAFGWLPWWPLVHRTKFLYYAALFEPYLILAITLCLGLILGRATAPLGRRAAGAAITAAYLITVLIIFYYFYPVFTAKIIPYQDWLSHMWYRVGAGWI